MTMAKLAALRWYRELFKGFTFFTRSKERKYNITYFDVCTRIIILLCYWGVARRDRWMVRMGGAGGLGDHDGLPMVNRVSLGGYL